MRKPSNRDHNKAKRRPRATAMKTANLSERDVVEELRASSDREPLPLPSLEDFEASVRRDEDERFFSQFDEFGFLKDGYLK